MLLLLVLWGSAGAQTYTPPPGSPLANGIHPRVFFTDSELQNEIAPYINSYESANFQTYIGALDGNYSAPASGKDRHNLMLDASNYAFLSYAVHSGYFNSYSFAHSAAEYASKAYEHAVEIDNRVRNQGLVDGHNDWNYIPVALATVYDWCTNYLTTSQKEFILSTSIYLRQTQYKIDAYPGHAQALGNGMNTMWYTAAFFPALAAFGDSDIGQSFQDSLNVYKDAIQWFCFDKVLDYGEYIYEGYNAHSEGSGYQRQTFNHFAFLVTGLSSAIGENLINTYNWLKTIPIRFFFITQPYKINDGNNGRSTFWLQRNDTWAMERWDKDFSQKIIGMVAHYVKNTDPNIAGFARWLLEDSQYALSQDYIQNSSIRTTWLFWKFLWGIKDVSKKTPSQAGINKSYRFGLGEAIFRSDLTTTNATKINFYTPKWSVKGHKHDDEGAFTINKYGGLALDAGNEKSSTDGYGNLPKNFNPGDPIFHNTIGVYNTSIPNLFYEYNSGDRKEGDTPYHPYNQNGGLNHIGDVKALRFEPDIFDYIDYDYTRAYKGENYVNDIRRKFLYIRDPNAPNYNNEEYVVIFDDVDVTSPSIKRRWMLHTAYQPNLIDDSWTQVQPGFWTSTNGSILEVTNNYANLHGRLFVKVLEPANYELRLRGGENGTNYYWFTDAEGNDLYRSGTMGQDYQRIQVGSYRLEIEDLANSNTSQFLTVLQIGDANTLSNMASVNAINTGLFVGAFVNQDRVALFNTTATPASAVSYTISTNKTVRHFITGLEPGVYFVNVDGNPVPGVNTLVDTDGVLYFEYSGSGTFSISKSNDVTPPQTPQGLRITK